MLYQPLAKTPVTITGNDAITFGEHAGRLINLSAAAGQAITLPAATGSGVIYRLRVATTITSNSTTIKVANATDVMTGVALHAADGGNTLVAFETAADTDTITFNGGTTGGIAGAMVTLEDAESGKFQVRVEGAATDTEATPFSATVS